jgi:uncharacterized protein (TIGR03435 family)
MNRRKEDIDKIVDAHLGLFDSPSSQDVAGSRERTFERLRERAAQGTRTAVVQSTGWKWRLSAVAAAAAAIVVIAVLTQWQANRNAAYAVVDAAGGGLYRVEGGDALRPGERIEANEAVRTNGGVGTVLKLADGSAIEMRSKSELFWERVSDGIRIRLSQGSVIVNAAKQRAGHFYVQTKDVTVSVIGTVFTVNAEEQGSRVSVIEGEVRVQQGTIETKLRPGEHVSTVPKAEPRALKEEISWSPKAGEHLALLQQSRPSNPSETPRQRFEEAAIRPCPPPQNPSSGARGGGGSGKIQVTPGRFYAPCVTVAGLLRNAHTLLKPAEGLMAIVIGQGMGDGDVRGGPEWISTDRYTIEAITDSSTDALTMTNVMLPDLLERRFQVKVHIETEQVPALALSIAAGGLKIKPFQDGDCEKEKKSNFPNPKPRCGITHGSFNGPNYRWEQANHAFSVFVWVLSHAFLLPVIDRTGITDNFALTFEYGPDETTPGPSRECQPRIPDQLLPCMGRPTAPSIHTELNRLGLKLEPIKAPREFIVVDRAERPSPN